jgi:Zn-dependent M16 (insulinase) family peptidase
LEKLLQCGSKQYPVRNIASEMSRRSFSLLNPSQTTDDYLMFSFNTPILKDFNNLFEVYCSMLFDPLMREEDFYEVVRRLTFEDRALGFTG